MLVMSETPISSAVPPKLTWFVNPIDKGNGLVSLGFIDGSGRVISVDQAGNISGVQDGSGGDSQLCLIAGNIATFFPSPRLSGPGAICHSFIIVNVPQ